MARPKTGKYDNLVQDIIDYTEQTEYPILKELCYLKHYNYDYVMQLQRDNEELSQSIKELLYKKESYLEREGIKGNLAQTMAVFTLKQLGWRDNIEFRSRYKNCNAVYVVYPDKDFIDEDLKEEKINIDYVVSLFGDGSHYYKEKEDYNDIPLSPNISLL